MNPAIRLKKILRPLIPDRLMARYRLARHSRQARTNVDVVLTDTRLRRRWLGTTPDTYRVVESSLAEEGIQSFEGVDVFGRGTERAMELLALPDADVGLVARVPPPAIVGRRRVEPPMEPVAIAVPRAVVEEVGGVPHGSEPMPGLLSRLRDAGRRFAVIPIEADPVDARRRDRIDTTPIAILAAVPLHDIGGGSRAAQLAIGLLKMGFHVVYVAMLGAQETVDLGLRYIHPNLEQYRADEFDAHSVADRARTPGLVLVEVPAEMYRDSIEALGGRGWTLAYDIIDDWSDPALGGEWYEDASERWLVDHADVVTASAPDLIDRARQFGRTATLIPNAVNADVFGPTPGERPEDLPDTAGPVLGYCGSLYGDWFDWIALRTVADAYPQGIVVVIGDTKGSDRDMPNNVVFLGLKAQIDLPAYIQRFDVGLLPFHITDTTHAVSPLKVYEYLASGVPVAAPRLRSLEGLDGVCVADDLVTAVQAALEAVPTDRDAVLRQHSWDDRVEALIAKAQVPRPSRPAEPVLIRRRPVMHYTRAERRVRVRTSLGRAQRF